MYLFPFWHVSFPPSFSKYCLPCSQLKEFQKNFMCIYKKYKMLSLLNIVCHTVFTLIPILMMLFKINFQIQDRSWIQERKSFLNLPKQKCANFILIWIFFNLFFITSSTFRSHWHSRFISCLHFLLLFYFFIHLLPTHSLYLFFV